MINFEVLNGHKNINISPEYFSKQWLWGSYYILVGKKPDQMALLAFKFADSDLCFLIEGF